MQENSTALRVLIVDDERLIRWSLSETLAHAGHVVIEASDANTAIRAVTDAREPIDVVLLDYRLSDSNDLTLLSTLRRLSPRSQVVLMTAYGAPEVTEGALELGACRVVHKPIEMRDAAALVVQAHSSRPQ